MGKKKKQSTPCSGEYRDLSKHFNSNKENTIVIEMPIQYCIIPVIQEQIKNAKHIQNNQVIESPENQNKED